MPEIFSDTIVPRSVWSFVAMDPPEHQQYCQLVEPWLSAHHVRTMEPKIPEICARLVDDVAD